MTPSRFVPSLELPSRVLENVCAETGQRFFALDGLEAAPAPSPANHLAASADDWTAGAPDPSAHREHDSASSPGESLTAASCDESGATIPPRLDSSHLPPVEIAVLDSLSAHIAILDARGRIVFTNRTWRKFAEHAALTRPLAGVHAESIQQGPCPERITETLHGLRRILQGELGEFTREYPCLTAEGRRWFRLSATPVRQGDFTGATVTCLDITGRRHAEERLARMNRLYRVLSDVNEAVVSIHERNQLFAAVCDIAVQEGQFRSAAICLYDQLSGDVHSICTRGQGLFPRDEIKFSIADPVRNCGTIGLAIRTGEAQVCNDALHEPRMRPWSDTIRQHGYGSIATFPIRSQGRIVGTLTLFSGETYYFEEDELGLLGRIEKNLSYAVEAMEKEAARLQAEKEVQRQRTLLESAQSIGRMGSWHFNNLTHRFECSDSACALFGIHPSQFEHTREHFFTFVLPEDLPLVLSTLASSTPENPSFEIQYRIRRPDGEVRWMFGRGTSEFDAEGQPVQRLGVVMDMTEMRQAQADRDESEARFRDLAENIEEVFWITDPNKRIILYVSPAYNRIWGRPRGAIYRDLGQWIDSIHPEDRPRLAEHLQNPPTGKYHEEYRIIRPDGSVRWISDRGFPVYDSNGVLVRLAGVARDITERKAAEVCLRASEESARATVTQLATILDYSADVICTVDGEGRFIQVNAASAKVWGYEPAELLGRPYMDFVHPDDHAKTAAEGSQLKDSGANVGFENRYIRKDGSIAHIQWSTRWSAEEQIYTCVARDVTEVRAHLERIAEQASLLDQAHEAIIVKDLDDRIIYWNGGAERTYGWKHEEAIGKNSSQLLHTDAARFHSACSVLLAEGAWEGEMIKKARNGRELTIKARWSLVRDPEGRPKSILAINSDITERKQLESQVLRSQRLESIGALAGGIAHDLNNILGPMLLSLELLKERFPDASAREIISLLEGSANRGAEIVRQVLSFGRGNEGRRTIIEVKHLLKDLAYMANETFLKNIQVRTEVPAGLWRVNGDPTQLHQILLNLCVNARDAMPDGGTITLSAENQVLDEQFVAANCEARPGSYVVLRVADTGTGIPQEIIDLIFDPFFTTKELGKGTGLGLSTSHGIVQSHHGFIRAANNTNQGATFSVYLPAEITSAPDTQPESEPKLELGQGELILVIDDEPSVREVTRQTLERFGYKVVVAGDGVEGVALFAKRTQEWAAVITDMMMPGMDGAACMRAIQHLRPGLPIVLTSGVDTNKKLQAVKNQASAYLAKPYTADKLLSTLRNVLRNHPTRHGPLGLPSPSSTIPATPASPASLTPPANPAAAGSVPEPGAADGNPESIDPGSHI